MNSQDNAVTDLIEHEFRGANFGDERLTKRLTKLAKSTMRNPTSSINQAEEDWASTKAAYNFFKNDKVSPETIVAPHQSRTRERMNGYQWLLALSDTVYFNYSRHLAAEGLGNIGKGKQGIIMHHSLITTCEGLPLGCLSQKIWSRGTEVKGEQRQLTPLEEKESYKWFEAMDECEARSPGHVNLVHVADREADIYEFLHHAQVLKNYYVIRARSPREIVEENKSSLIDTVAELPVSGKYCVTIPKRKGEIPARDAEVTVRFGQVDIKAPEYLLRKDPTLENVSAWVVYAIEETPPKDEEAICWVLLSNVPVKTLDDALCRIHWYKLRWIIEVYHKVIKSGCLVEDCRLESAKKLGCYLALNSVIAWRLLWIKHMNHQAPTSQCTDILTPMEYRILYSKINRTKKLPNRIPTVRQATRWIATLGGFLGRKSDGEPGVTTLWRGWRKLQDYVEICFVLEI